MIFEVIIKLDNAASQTSVLNALKKLKVRLRQMHEGTNDPELASYFYANVNSIYDAQQLIFDIKNIDSVEAAYLKPQAELP